jgi:protein-tyrosine phosphatase
MNALSAHRPGGPPRKLLVLCTGNYYRSRYVEALFNFLAKRDGLYWIADSRGLDIDHTGLNAGPISLHTREALLREKIDADLDRMPLDLTYGDLRASDMVVAVHEPHHRSLLESRFPGWSDRAVYWNVPDLDQATPDVALARLRGLTESLAADLLGRQSVAV